MKIDAQIENMVEIEDSQYENYINVRQNHKHWFFYCGFLPNFNFKNIIPIYVKELLWQKWPISPNSKNFFFQIVKKI
jgi:hypothetical protein